jgi:hypothetical protein
VKITVIAAGFREVKKGAPHHKPAFLPQTWKAGREAPAQAQISLDPPPSVVHQVAQNVRDVASEVPADDLDVPTFLRRQAQKA